MRCGLPPRHPTAQPSSAPDFEVLRDTCCLVRTEKGKLALAADVNVARKDANLKDRVTMLMIID